jgi:hypothetical protein
MKHLPLWAAAITFTGCYGIPNTDTPPQSLIAFRNLLQHSPPDTIAWLLSDETSPLAIGGAYKGARGIRTARFRLANSTTATAIAFQSQPSDEALTYWSKVSANRGETTSRITGRNVLLTAYTPDIVVAMETRRGSNPPDRLTGLIPTADRHLAILMETTSGTSGRLLNSGDTLATISMDPWRFSAWSSSMHGTQAIAQGLSDDANAISTPTLASPGAWSVCITASEGQASDCLLNWLLFLTTRVGGPLWATPSIK